MEKKTKKNMMMAAALRGMGVCGYMYFKNNPNAVSDMKMAAKNMARVRITLACTECKQRNYNTYKNKKNTADRLELNKYCRFCKKTTVHKETK